MFSQDHLQELLNFYDENGQVCSLYLNTDTGQDTRDTIKLRVRNLLKDAGVEPPEIERIERYLEHEHEWSQPGLALFSTPDERFFRAYPIAVSFRNRARLGHRPYVKPLSHLLQHYAHYGVILVDRVGASFFEFHLGELQSTGGTFGEEIRRQKRGSGSSAAGMRGGHGDDRHDEEAAQRNLRDAAQEAYRFFARKKIRRLFLGGATPTVAAFRELLPKQLQSCVAGTFAIDLDANESEVRRRALELLAESNAARERKLVEELLARVAQGGTAVAGIDETLKAVGDGRVDTLIVADGWRMPGYTHPETGYVVANPIHSPYDMAELTPLNDIVETAVERTMNQGGAVEVVADSDDLVAAGSIGALLRY